MGATIRKLRHRVLQKAAPGRLTWEDNFRPPWALHGAGTIEIGPRTYWFGDSRISAWKDTDSVTIGAYCCIAAGAHVMAGGNHSVAGISAYPFTMIDRWREWNAEPQPAQRLTIGNDVWIGSRALVIGDVTIGDGAVVAAGAVVVDDVAPYAIAAGVPAKVIRERFSADQVAALRQLRWWSWPEADVVEAEPLLRDADIEALARFARERGLPLATVESLRAGLPEGSRVPSTDAGTPR